MENSIVLSPRKVVFLLSFALLYFYLSDRFKQPDFKANASKLLEPIVGNNTTHTFFGLIENYSNTFAAALASSSITFVANLPVSFLLIKINQSWSYLIIYLRFVNLLIKKV